MKIMIYTKARNNLRQLIDEVIDSSTETVITSEKSRDVVVSTGMILHRRITSTGKARIATH